MPITTTIADRIAEIVFDVPPVNAFDSETWMSLPAIITAAASNPEVNCVLIRAAEASRGFCGGVDIKEMQAHPERITVLNRGNYLTFKAIREAGLTLDGGSVIRVVDMLPGKQSPMHRTNSIDYGIVLEGEIELELEDGAKKTVRQGGIIVQRGTNHLWRNTTDKVCWIAFVLIEAPAYLHNGVPLHEDKPH